MAVRGSHGLLEQLRGLVLAGCDGDRSDRELLARYVAARDEAAFAALVHRHGAVVWSVCRRSLNRVPDAEDAFQATFLILARKAGSIQQLASVGSWLHGVAYRVARKLRADAVRRAKDHLAETRTVSDSPEVEVSWREVRTILDEELDRLPEKYRAPLVLCYLEGLTQDEAARQLGWQPGVLRGRLDRGRQRLKARLARRGLALSAALLGTALAPAARAAPASVTVAAVKAGAGVAISPSVIALAQGVLRTMFLTKMKSLTAVTLALGLGGLLIALASAPLGAQDPFNPFTKPNPFGGAAPPPEGPKPTTPPMDLEKRVAELEKKVLNLTKEVESLRGQPKGKSPLSAESGDIVIIRIKNAMAAEVAKTLSELMDGGTGKRITVTVDERSNSLMVRANPADQKLVEAFLSQMDKDQNKPNKPGAEDGPMFKTYTVKKADAKAVVALLEKIYQGSKIRMVPVNDNTLGVYGLPSELIEIEKIINEIEAVPAKP